MSSNFGSTTMLDSLKSQIGYNIGSKTIFVVSKIKCRACVEAKALLSKLSSETGVKPSVLDLDNYPKHLVIAITNWLSSKTGIKTVPQIFINGKFVGGNDDVQNLHWKGRLLFLIGKKAKREELSKAGSNQILGQAHKFPSPIESEFSIEPIMMDQNSDIFNFNSTILNRNPITYRPATFMIDDESHTDILPQLSQPQILISDNTLSAQRSSLNRCRSCGSLRVQRSSPNIGVSEKPRQRSSSALATVQFDFDEKSLPYEVGPEKWVAVHPSASRIGESQMLRVSKII